MKRTTLLSLNTAPSRAFLHQNFLAKITAASLALIFCISGELSAQCPTVEAVMIDACGTEFLNEFVVINSGGGFNTSDIEFDYDVNNNIISSVNNDVNTNNGNLPPGTPCGISPGSTGAFTGCSNLISVGAGVDIPANSIVIFQTSTAASNNTYNAASLCGAGQCVYVVASSCTRSAGAFSNGGAGGIRTTVFSIAGGCSQTITYNQASVVGGNGAYYLPLSGPGTYGNAGCVVPPVSPAPNPPDITPIANVNTCGSYILPPIPGTNLPPNAAYYTGTNGTGTQYNPGDEIFSNLTLYAYAQIGPVGCSDQVQFTITINPGPSVNQPNDITVCAGVPVSVPITGSAGATFPWTNDNTLTGLGASGTGNISFTSANVAVQQVSMVTITPTQGICMGTPATFSITVDPKPTVDDPPNITVCAGDPVDVAFTSPNGSPTFNWTNSNVNIGLGASGSGDLSFTAANVVSTQTGTVTVTPVENGCTGIPQTFTITVGPLPSVNPPNDVTVCGGSPVTVNFSGSPGGTTFAWTNDNTAVGLGAMGTGNISFTSANVANQEVANIIVVPTLGSCAGAAQMFTITINPKPTVDDPPNITVCAGDPVDVTFTSPNGSPNFNWTNTNTIIGLPAIGNGDISFIAANVGSVQTGTVNVTPSLTGCTGPAQNFTITVNPAPNVTQPSNVTSCGGSTVTVNFSGTAGATFSWTNDNTAIGLADSGTGGFSFTSSVVATQEVATITVTPTLNGCPGTPRTFTITINPGPTMNPVADQGYCGGQTATAIFSGAGVGATYSWTNTNPAIGLPGSGSGNLNFTTSNVATTQTGTITVTPSLGGCPGTPETFTITVSPAPSMNQPPNLTLCGGQSVVLNFSGTAGATFNWVNSNPAIGLAASGSGNLNFTTASVATQQTGTITVTPVIGGCSGTAVNFTITVNPAPVMTDPIDLSVCPGFIVNVNFNGGPVGTTYAWTNNNIAIGLSASGSGNISFNAANVATTQTGTITVTPTANGCPGAPQTFDITVTALPTVTDPADQTVCAGAPVAVNFAGSAGATLNWTNSNPAIGLGASGTGNISFNAANVATTQTGTITVTPTAGGCTGTSQSFTVTVNPVPTVSQPANTTVCGGASVTTNFTGSAGATFSWTNSNPNIGLAASGNGNISFTSANVANPETGTITVTPNANGCPGTPATFTILVNPNPVVTPVADLSACGGQPVAVNFGGPAGTVFNWTNSNIAIGLGASGNGNIAFTAAGVVATQTGTINVTPTLNGCTGPVEVFTISVVTAPNVSDPADETACGGTPVAVSFSGSAGATFDWTNSNPAIGLPASGSGDISFTGANVASAQTATISVTPTLGLCSGAPVNFNITINPAVTANIAGNQTICSGDNTTLTASGGSGYDWDSGQTTAAITVSPLATTTYTVIVNNAAGCADTTSTTVTVNQPSTSMVQQSSCNPADTGVTVVTLTNFAGCDSVVTTVTTLLPTDTTNLTGATCDPNAAGTFTQILSNIFGCDSVIINIITFDPANIDTTQLTQTTCDPNQSGITQALFTGSDGCDSLVITTVNLLPTDTTQLSSFTCNPNAAGTFTQTLSNIFGCDSVIINTITFDATNIDTTQLTQTTCDPNQSGISQAMFTGSDGCDSLVITTVNLLPTDTTQLSSFTCNPNAAGTFTQTLSNIFGCDSVIINTITFDPANVDTTQIAQTTCDPNQAGSSQMLLTGADGCDSLVITTVSLLPTSTTNLTAMTCDPNAVGTFTQILPNQFGCDSTIVTTVTLSPTSTTNLTATTCDPNAVGVFSQVLPNQFGCDSTVITTVTLSPTSTTNLTATTCDPNAVGVFSQVLPNQFGCDSTIITTVTLSPTSTTNLTATTCNPNAVGTFTQVLPNQFGCDSTIITMVTFDPAGADTVLAVSSTCDPTLAGVFSDTYPNQFGCDSTIITTVLLLPTDTTTVFELTCDPNLAGTFPVLWQNQFGCDSLAIRVVELSPTDTTYLNNFTCDPNQATTITDHYPNQFGCDSMVVTTIIFDPTTIDSTFLNATTCDPAQTGFSSMHYPGSDGCDSVVVTYTLFDPVLCAVTAFVTTDSASCPGVNDGTATIIVTGGAGPFDYTWTDGAGNTGSGQISGANVPELVTGLATGQFTVSITGAAGPTATVVTEDILTAASVSVQTEAILAYNSFAISCNGLSDGSAQAVAQGGTPPYQFAWENGANTDTVSGLSVGAYGLTVTDNKGCTSTSTVQITEPLALQLFAEAAPVHCGDSLAQVTLVVTGGAGATNIEVDGQPFSGLTTTLETGTHQIVATDANGCQADTSVVLNVPTVPQLFLPADTTIRLGETITVTATTNLTDWQSLTWSPLPDTSCANCLDQTWKPEATQFYTLLIVDSAGCAAQADIRVIVRKDVDIYIPNVFSPDGDGYNDFWEINFGPTVTNLENLRIFDRWGNQVYNWDDPILANSWPGWDGRFGGKPVELGVYVYYLEARLVNGDLHIRKGDVTVVRRR